MDNFSSHALDKENLYACTAAKENWTRKICMRLRLPRKTGQGKFVCVYGCQGKLDKENLYACTAAKENWTRKICMCVRLPRKTGQGKFVCVYGCQGKLDKENLYACTAAKENWTSVQEILLGFWQLRKLC